MGVFLAKKCGKGDEDCRVKITKKRREQLVKKAKNALFNQCANHKLVKCHPLNSKRCENQYNSYKCICNDAWTGEYCQKCNHCKTKNTLACLNHEKCKCKVGWKGKKCGIKIKNSKLKPDKQIPTLFLHKAEPYSTTVLDSFKPGENLAEIAIVVILIAGIMICCFASYKCEIKILE